MGNVDPPDLDLNEVVEVDELSVAMIEIENDGCLCRHPVLDVTGVHSVGNTPFRRTFVMDRTGLAWLAANAVVMGRELYGSGFDETLARFECEPPKPGGRTAGSGGDPAAGPEGPAA